MAVLVVVWLLFLLFHQLELWEQLIKVSMVAQVREAELVLVVVELVQQVLT
jgi:hypothetical protein